MLSTSTTPEGGRSPGARSSHAIIRSRRSRWRPLISVAVAPRLRRPSPGSSTRPRRWSETISPVDQTGRRDAILPRRALQIGPTQEFQDDGHFAFGGPAARAGFGGRFRGILSRPTGSLGRPGIVFLRAGHAFSPLEHFLHKMFPMHCPTKSRAGGAEAQLQKFSSGYGRQWLEQAQQAITKAKSLNADSVPVLLASGLLNQ